MEPTTLEAIGPLGLVLFGVSWDLLGFEQIFTDFLIPAKVHSM